MNDERPGGRSHPTVRDVAELAGVSMMTVSRVLNDKPLVAPATAAKVQEAIAALRFERNELARSLRPGHRTRMLGLVTEDLTNPFFPALAEGADRVAQEHGYLLISASAHADAERERELVTALHGRRIDGLLLVPFGDDHRYISQMDFHARTVCLDRPANGLRTDAVLVDNVGGIQQAVAHLVEHGHTRIAFIGDRATSVHSARQRLQSFRRSVRAHIGPLDERLVVTCNGLIGEAETAHAEAAVHDLLSLSVRRRPTAIVANDNRVVIGVLRALEARQDVLALIGFDDSELNMILGITVVRTNPSELGRRAAQLVFERIAGRSGRPQRIVLPTELVARGSGEISP
jgi:LacI family transcriptional regulator